MTDKEVLVDLLDEDKPVANQSLSAYHLFLLKKFLNRNKISYLKRLLRIGILKNDFRNLQSL